MAFLFKADYFHCIVYTGGRCDGKTAYLDRDYVKREVIIIINPVLFLSSLFILTIPNVVIFIRNINVIFKELGTGTSRCTWMIHYIMVKDMLL